MKNLTNKNVDFKNKCQDILDALRYCLEDAEHNGMTPQYHTCKKAIDLIQYLRRENKELQSLCNKTYDDLTKEIERLTSIAEYQQGSNMERWRIIHEKDNQIAKLQKQVDELKEEKLDAVCDLNMRIVELDNELKQTVKDTAKEIFQSIGDIIDDCDSRFNYKDYQWHKDLCKKYGVEVE